MKERVHERAQLATAVEEVARGGSVIDSKIVDSLVGARSGLDHSPLAELTTREREVLAEIAQGKSNAAIAESLVLTKRAVEKHINAIFMKFGLAQADDVSKRVKATLIFLSDTAPRGRTRTWVVGTPGPARTPPHVTPASPIAVPCCAETLPQAMSEDVRDEGRTTDSLAATGSEDEDVRVLTVDDQAVFRRVAHDVIVATLGFEPIGEAGSGEEAVEAVDRLRPDLVLLDVRMPGIGGIEAARRITSAHPDTVVVLVSIEEPDEVGHAVRGSGAATLVRKQDFGPALLRRVWAQHAGIS